MKTLNHLNARDIGRPILCASAVPMPSFAEPARGSIKLLLIAACLATGIAAPAWAAQQPDEGVSQSAVDTAMSTDATVDRTAGSSDSDGTVDPDSAAHANWRAQMAQNSTRAEGCFQASYPDIFW